MPKGQEKEISKTSTGYTPDSVRDANDISNVLTILDNPVIKTTPFGANVSGENSYKRAERLSAALHLITNHVPETEPLRSSIRQKGLDLLSLILELRSAFRAPASEKGQAALAMIRELVSHIRLLAVSGFVSPQNANAVAEALDELGSLIVVSQRSALAEQLTVSREHLIPPASVAKPDRGTAQYRTNIPKKVHQKDNEKTNGNERAEETSSRTGRIIDILKLGGVLGIKDISSNLPQYSEKMIQRELASLVESGRVQKTGDKRWSRYQVVR